MRGREGKRERERVQRRDIRKREREGKKREKRDEREREREETYHRCVDSVSRPAVFSLYH